MRLTRNKRKHDVEAPAPEAPAAPAEPSEYERLIEHRVERHVRVDQPVVFVSQIQRSGGTLLSQLFDMHPQLHAHPNEFHIGWPKPKQDWPPLDPSESPERWFELVREQIGERHFSGGYTKYARKGKTIEGEELDVFPFLQPPEMLRRVFVELALREPPATRREIFDRYWTAYFNCWLDNQNLYPPDKRWVTGFAARMMMRDDNVEAFFADYPDGRIVSIIRDPVSWYVSAVNHQPETYADPVASTEQWKASADAMLRALDRYGSERVRLMAFERLVRDTEATMTALADWLGIEFTPELLAPTFNGRPIKADSSFKVENHGILRDTVDRSDRLAADVSERIRATAGDAFERVLARVP